jgi:hypothetical protein
MHLQQSAGCLEQPKVGYRLGMQARHAQQPHAAQPSLAGVGGRSPGRPFLAGTRGAAHMRCVARTPCISAPSAALPHTCSSSGRSALAARHSCARAAAARQSTSPSGLLGDGVELAALGSGRWSTHNVVPQVQFVSASLQTPCQSATSCTFAPSLQCRINHLIQAHARALGAEAAACSARQAGTPQRHSVAGLRRMSTAAQQDSPASSSAPPAQGGSAGPTGSAAASAMQATARTAAATTAPLSGSAGLRRSAQLGVSRRARRAGSCGAAGCARALTCQPGSQRVTGARGRA